MRRGFLACVLLCALAGTARADSEPYVGDLLVAAYTFCPNGTLEANGQLLSISDYTSLYSLIGTKYGGDGQNTFALPKLNPAYTASSVRPVLMQCINVYGAYPSQR